MPPAAGEQAPPAAAEARPHVALILPLKSASYGRHAESVRQGFLAASKVTAANLPVVVYEIGEDPSEVLTAYRRALDGGARAVAGPLTRDGVTALAKSGDVAVPTLALNTPESEIRAQQKLFLFGLQAEGEARQIAQIGFAQGKRSALTISDQSPLTRRIHNAFVAEWTKSGGRHHAEFLFSTVPANLNALRLAAASADVDFVFLALDAQRARQLRAQLPGYKLTYATSLIVPQRPEPLANFDLGGIRFIDMPWLLQPDHPAVMVFPRAEGSPRPDFDRLYALGIDAYRIVQDLLAGLTIAQTPLDGVTGRISLAPGQQFVRELTSAQFSDGKTVVVPPERQ